jgi:hypothetical protein
MPSEDTTSTTAIVLARSKVDMHLFGQFVGSEIVVSRKSGSNWLYVLKGDTKKSFHEFEMAINTLESHLRTPHQHEPLFLPVLEAEHQTSDRVILGTPGLPLLNEVFDALQASNQTEFWRMNSTVPPRKRAIPDSALLIPGLKRLSKQLRVDFNANVHGGEGKRKREPTRSIYEEAVMLNKKAVTSKTKKQKGKKQSKQYENDSSSPDISEIDESEFKRSKLISIPQDDLSKILALISSAHAAIMEVKDEMMKTMAEFQAKATTTPQ